MDPVKLKQALDDVFDRALLHHGFTSYMRDYQLVIHTTADPRSGIAPATMRYLFRCCVQADCKTTVPAETWRESLDDRLITYQTGVDLDGYVWGVEWQPLYPGATIITDSPTARNWAAAVGIDFHEVRIRTNAHDLTLIFSDLQIEELPSEEHGPDHLFPIR